jgi:tripartite-type tricarboxylate transporter receptor subunit TctC
MANTLGQQIIIENIIGSGGTTAAIRAMRAPPDGYTLMMGHMGTHGAAVALYPNLAYSPASDFEPIGMAAGMPVLILGRKGLPARTLAEFVADARSNPAPMHMAHAGLGSVSYASCLLLNAMIGIHPTMTPFQGTGPAMNALAAGRVDYLCDQIVGALPKIQAGLVTAYATGSAQRSPALPELPTAAEAGLPEFRVSAWNALFAPKGTPPTIVAALNRSLSQALDNPAIRKQLLDLGGEVPGAEERTPQALRALVSSEVDRWMRVNADLAVPSR